MNLLNETLNILKENGKTPADVRWVDGALEQDGEKPSLDSRGGPRVYSFSIKFREDVRINANEFLDLIGKDRIFAFTTKSDDGAAAKELIGTAKSVSFYGGNVVKITVAFPAEVKE